MPIWAGESALSRKVIALSLLFRLILETSTAPVSYTHLKVNICQCNTSLVIWDCKWELLRDCGSLLERMGYEIKV